MTVIHGVEGGLRGLGKGRNSHSGDWEAEGMLGVLRACGCRGPSGSTRLLLYGDDHQQHPTVWVMESGGWLV